MILTSGNKIIYPCQGPCLIGAVVQRMVDDRPMMFQELLVLSGGGSLFVPVDNVPTIGIRPLLKKAEIPKLLARLRKPTRSADNWKERANDNLRLLTSGSAFALAEVVESLTELSETRTLTSGDYKALERAKRLLVCEISEVMGEARSAVEEEIDKALKARRDRDRSHLERTSPVPPRNGTRRRQLVDLPIPQEMPVEPGLAPPKRKIRWPWGRR